MTATVDVGFLVAKHEMGGKLTPDEGRLVSAELRRRADDPDFQAMRAHRQAEREQHTAQSGKRRVKLQTAEDIPVRAVRWLWDRRLPHGSLSLLAGREGIGKSTAAYTLAADLTRGRLNGIHLGTPRPVMVAATEDSWAHTIVPRLMAANADLSLIYRVEVTTSEDAPGGLSLPADIPAVEDAIRSHGIALVLLDPLMSRLDASLDTHKDSEVRQALEPLTALADRTGATVLGLIHVNKSRTNDPLTSIMGSRAFTAVARSVLYVLADQDQPGLRLLGLAKNNLGPMDLPTLRFTIVAEKVADTDEGPVVTGKLQWGGEDPRSLSSVLEDAQEHTEVRTATSDAGEWLIGYLADNGGTAPSADIRSHGGKQGHSYDSLQRARKHHGITSQSSGFPRRSYWSMPDTQPAQSVQPVSASQGESALTALTAFTGAVDAVSAVDAVDAEPPAEQLTVGPA